MQPPGPEPARAPKDSASRDPARRQALGRLGEDAAARYLEGLGLSVLSRNFRVRRGEIDLIARDGPALVFVEVKTRRGTGYGTPAASVTPVKVRRLRRAALEYLDQHTGPASGELRFDLIAVEVDGRGAIERIEHLRGIE